MTDAGERTLLTAVAEVVGDAIERRRSEPVAPQIDEAALRDRLGAYDFADPRRIQDVAEDLLDLLQRFAVRSDHPRYFGLFNPPATAAGIAADLITAAINPQLAVWSHAPAAAEIERKLVRLFGSFVWPDQELAGTFTSGGSEANLTALLSALASRYPNWDHEGLPRNGAQPVIYVSSEAHLAWIKIARMCGLGSSAVRLVPPEDGLRLTGETLARAIDASETAPVLLVATAGTTAHGAIDDIEGIVAVGRSVGAHVHVDAAWAGGALVSPARRSLFDGIERADSVTIDPHKWLATPMGAGLHLARDWKPLERAFAVSTGYMPSASSERRDAYIHSVQWSRRFIGGKLFLTLAAEGLDGCRDRVERAFALGDELRSRLRDFGWRILNRTPLPLICFAPEDASDECVSAIESEVVASGAAWISSVRLEGRRVLRACITSFETTEDDVEALVLALERARAHVTQFVRS
ncbi:MAG TPA: aminotransferase class V-fold PLP-dependent enzyme [Caulobacteraceae bacterium]|jgi:aromatic-L-amino-acid decarboxylase|nr:aminotransferase class V-fold PLP-dependent enzyme [Caulobacteraceae bacterium]